MLVPPFTRAFLKSPSSRGLSAIAELLVMSLILIALFWARPTFSAFYALLSSHVMTNKDDDELYRFLWERVS